MNKIIIIDNKKFKKCIGETHGNDLLVKMEDMYSYGRDQKIYTNYCKSCYTQRRIKLKRNKRIENGMEWVLWDSARNSAKIRQLKFTITVEDIVIPNKCPILGIELINDVNFHYFNKQNGRFNIFNHPNYPTLDRIDSAIGYEAGNVNVISWRANSLKKDSSFKEIEKLYIWWKDLTK